MATIAKSATRAKLKVSYEKKKGAGVSVPLSVPMGGGVVDHGKATKREREKKAADKREYRKWTFSGRCFNGFFFLMSKSVNLNIYTRAKLSRKKDIIKDIINRITAKNFKTFF